MKDLVVAYLRVSIEKQRQAGKPFEIQKEFISRYCQHNNINLPEEHIFVDVASGVNEERPALTKMRELIKDSKSVKCLLVYSIDRLTRSVLLGEVIAQEVRAKRGSIISVTQGFDDTTPHGNMIRQTLTVIAELERTTILQRTRNGSEKSRKNGFHIGSAPLGYDNVGNSITKGFGHLKINEREKQIVQLIFKLRKEKTTIRGIIKILTSKHMYSKNGKVFSPGTIQAVLDNELFYQGKISSEAYDIEQMTAKHPAILSDLC